RENPAIMHRSSLLAYWGVLSFRSEAREAIIAVHAVQVSAADQAISLQKGIMRSAIAACAILVLLIGTADAAHAHRTRSGSAAHSWSTLTSIPVSAPYSTPKRCRLTIMRSC